MKLFLSSIVLVTLTVFASSSADNGSNVRVTKEAKGSKTPKFSKSAKLVKSAKSEKSVKAAKGTKKGKKGEKKTQINAEEECILPVIKGKVGEPYWLQTGQVMTQWEEAYGYPRKSFTSKSKSRKGAKSGSRKIVNNDQYMVHCNQKGYVPDEVCIYTCIDGTLDTTMYCNKNPEDVCVLGRELTITEQCPLDFDSDAPFHDGKSLKQWWKEVLDRLHFKSNEIFDGTSGEEIHLGHGAIAGLGYGFAIQFFGMIPQPDNKFDASAIDIGGYTSDGYEYGPDTLYNSKYIVDSFVQDLETEDTEYGVPKFLSAKTFKNPKLRIVSLLKDHYDPCDDTPYLGFPPECFLYHPAGLHLGNGLMFNFHSPLSNGEIDLQGVCTGSETSPPIFMPAVGPNMPNIEGFIEESGGVVAAHPASGTMHLCIDDDIYHPRVCMYHTDDTDIDGMIGTPLEFDARPFMPTPTELRNKLCKKREADPDICKGPFNNITYPYPWTQHL